MNNTNADKEYYDLIVQKIEEYSALQNEKEQILMQKQALIDEILTDEIKEALSDIDAEFSTRLIAIDDQIAKQEKHVKEHVLFYSGTVKGMYHQFVWNKARVSWNTDALEGYAKVHAEILAFKTVGQPSISVRGVK